MPTDARTDAADTRPGEAKDASMWRRLWHLIVGHPSDRFTFTEKPVGRRCPCGTAGRSTYGVQGRNRQRFHRRNSFRVSDR